MPTDKPETAIVLSEPGKSIQEITLNELALMDSAMAIVEKRQEMQVFFMRAAVAMTSPQDWLLSREKDGTEKASLCSPAAEKIATLWGIEIPSDSIRPRDEQGIFRPELTTKSDERVYTGYYDAYCALTKMSYRNLQFSRSNKEKFLGRSNALTGQGELTEDFDHRKAVRTGMLTDAVRHVTGLRGMTVEDLQEHGIDTSKCRKGHGYGSSTERGATKVADSKVTKHRNAFGEIILKMVNGDATGAKKVLKEITKNPDKGLKGIDTVTLFTAGWQIKQACGRLREHELWDDGFSVELDSLMGDL